MNTIDSLFALYLLGLLTAKVECNVTKERINTKCPSPQYIELGNEGIIRCVLKDFYSVIWYTDVDFNTGTPTVRLQNSIMSGNGYKTGEFGMHINGSLIIYEVQLSHEQMYTVAFAKSDDDLYDIIKVRTILVVKPDVPFPVIGQCDSVCDKCYAEVMEPTIKCSVRDIRPNITLAILRRTPYGDRDIPNDKTVTSDAVGHTYTVTTSDVFIHPHLLVVLVCKASSLPELLEKSESTVLVLNKVADINVTPKHLNIFLNTKMQLKCANHEIGYGVWKKRSFLNPLDLDLLLYSVLANETFTEIFDDEITVEDNISLLIQKTQVHHEGIYVCIFGDGRKQGVTAYSVNVTVPSYPYIKGCNQQQYCVLEASYDGNLTCSVKGIRPKVELQWRTLSEVQNHLISFKNNRLTVVENDDTFDVSLVSEYHVRETSLGRLTVKCEMIALDRKLLNGNAKMDLLFKTGITVTDQTNYSLLGIVPVMVILFLLLGACGVIQLRRVCRESTITGDCDNKEEMTPLSGRCQSDLNNIKEMERTFLDQLRGKYRDLYEAIQPIPFIKGGMHCVDEIFVEGGIEFLDSKRGKGQGGNGQWKSSDTYQNVLNNLKDKPKRGILEGEPGYGKSTIALKFVYDWCNSIESSPLKDFNILIFLRLRQLGGVTSIYRAIKQFILPKDSQLSETNIQNILQGSNSVVIILDGFDEYPDHENSQSDINSIIANEMFQDFAVVLTTRSSSLPKKYPPLTKRVRLTGFDEEARRCYIHKAVAIEDSNTVREIEGYLEENPILSDLCQVPLLFVIFAHMTYENEDFRKLTSVTTFFRYMMTCFHSHMKNKMQDENILQYELFETGHHRLSELAFKSVSRENNRIVWGKEEMSQILGGEVYDKYVRTGILVEEEVREIIDDPGSLVTEHVQYKTKVRFYHKLFCEWYAAHYLAFHIEKNPNLDLSFFLQHLEPFNVQYLYQFSCGINYKSFTKITNYLKSICGGERFAIPCILEQTGKTANIIDTIQSLCQEDIIVSGHDSSLMQRSFMKLLDIAAKSNIRVNYLELHNCIESADDSKETVKLRSGLILTSKVPVIALIISLYDRRMTEEQYIAILKFTSMCSSLKVVGFESSPPPYSFDVRSIDELSTLLSNNVKVKYYGVVDESPNYILNLRTGRWENDDGSECTESGREKMNEDWSSISGKTEKDFKQDVKQAREEFRKFSEQRKEGRTSINSSQ